MACKSNIKPEVGKSALQNLKNTHEHVLSIKVNDFDLRFDAQQGKWNSK